MRLDDDRDRPEATRLPSVPQVGNVLSERLALGNWSEVTPEAAFQIYGDPEVTCWLGDGQHDETLAASQARVANYQRRMDALKNGSSTPASLSQWNQLLGIWPLLTRQDSTVVGTMMLKPLPDERGQLTEAIEIGWHLRRDQWGHGFATEAGLALLQRAFQGGIPRVHAVTSLENLASQNVARRIGMRPMGRTNAYYGMTVELFTIEADEFIRPD